MQFILLQSIIVYLGLTIIMLYFAFLSKRKNKYACIYIAIAVYSIIFGLRYMVGSDFLEYGQMYDDLERFGKLNRNNVFGLGEFSFYYITNIIASHTLGKSFFFAFWAAIHLIILFYTFKNQKYILPYLIFVFMVGCVWLTFANGLRQITAVCLWILSIKYAVSQKRFIHYILVFAAVTMHNSAIILLFFYPLINYKLEWFKSIKVQITLILFSLIIMNINLAQSVFDSFDNITNVLGYSKYIENGLEGESSSINLGIGFYIGLIINLLCVVYSNRVKMFINNKLYIVLYNFYFIGVLVKYAFIDSQLIGRVNYYFSNIGFIILAYTIYYAYIKEKKLYTILIVMVCLLFGATLYRGYENSALFIFNWQEDYFYLKEPFINYFYENR